ncbi:MAG: alkaline phosphatase family protein [Microcella sp.]|uniref:alkaline phosphatase family protein n=1 Tax=Microcella sp. TaxID=1913979 RepID=UPI00271DE452|nr:alkaline phosphatase family protein [Microcella sp.]MDO8337244.1 alkaline phosphatase family protein [Microcella sp.]
MTARPGLDRRTFLTAIAAGGASVLLSATEGTAWAARPVKERTRVYVLVVDGCRPDEISATLTPRLAELRAAGTTFPAARSLPVMETIPNHVMMMTGVRPDRSGVPANAVYDRAEGVIRDLDRPNDLRFPTIIERLNERGRTTGTVLSKQYLYGIFGERATYRWEPSPLVPITEHAPDAATVDALIAMVDGPDPDLVFANLGDVDRVGHSDLTGTTLQAARSAALLSTDLQVGRFVDRLVASGKWSSSILIVTADHSMDWSIPTNVISITQLLNGSPELKAGTVIAQNGGADLLYWVGAADRRDAALAEISTIVAAHPGVLEIRSPAELRLGPEAGDLIATCRAGWRFSDPAVVSNPIPGNHGHPATEPIPFFVSGGSPRVRRATSSSAQARTIDIAPTVGSLFSLRTPSGGYDGSVRSEAFVA